MEWLSKPEPRPVSRWDEDWAEPTVSYAAPQPQPREKSTYQQEVRRAAAPSPAGPQLQLQPGDSVRHSAFGQGLVLSVRPMGGDALLEVAFDQVGTKKLMQKAAGPHLQKL